MKRYFFHVQRDDGSIGLHAESSQGSMFTTALSYVALRTARRASPATRA